MRAINTVAVFLCCPVNWSSLFIYLFIYFPIFLPFLFSLYKVLFCSFLYCLLRALSFTRLRSYIIPIQFYIFIFFCHSYFSSFSISVTISSIFLLCCSPYIFIYLSSVCSPAFILLFQLLLQLLSYLCKHLLCMSLFHLLHFFPLYLVHL
jgi:hypothetical protein